MRIVIITEEDKPHLKHFCVYLGRRHELVRVIHPAASRSDVWARLRRTQREMAGYGIGQTLGRAATKLADRWIGWDWAKAIEEPENRFFPDVAATYDEVVRPVAVRVENVNTDTTLRLVQEAAPDVVLCHGGPIYRAPLIKACRTMINFHSGVSPLYNGASTIMFAFANGHFRFCGGTLMTMSPAVDGGDILAHYLPAIEIGDTPATLFMKTVRFAAEAADRFLVHVQSAGTFAKCPQPSPFFYYRSRDRTGHYARQVRRRLQGGGVAKATRNEEFIEYYTSANDQEACFQVRQTIDRLLGFEC